MTIPIKGAKQFSSVVHLLCYAHMLLLFDLTLEAYSAVQCKYLHLSKTCHISPLVLLLGSRNQDPNNYVRRKFKTPVLFSQLHLLVLLLHEVSKIVITETLLWLSAILGLSILLAC